MKVAVTGMLYACVDSPPCAQPIRNLAPSCAQSVFIFAVFLCYQASCSTLGRREKKNPEKKKKKSLVFSVSPDARVNETKCTLEPERVDVHVCCKNVR